MVDGLEHGVRNEELESEQRAEHARGRYRRHDDRRPGAWADRPAGPRGGRRVDRSAAARQLAGAGGAEADGQDAVRIAAAGGGRALRPRRGRAARALLPAAAQRTERHQQGAAAYVSRDAAAQHLQDGLRRLDHDGHRPGADPGPEAVDARLHAGRSRADADPDPVEREGPAGGARRRDRAARGEHPADVQHGDAATRLLHEAGDAAQLRRE